MSEAALRMDVLDSVGIERDEEREVTSAELETPLSAAGWDPEIFGLEQIRGLVRRVFFSDAERRVRQVVLSAAEAETDVRSVCRQVGEALAMETAASVAVAGGTCRVLHDTVLHESIADRDNRDGRGRLRQIATRARGNLWLVPRQGSNHEITVSALHRYLSEMRRDFDYSIVQARPAAESMEGLAMAQFADGIILVLSARHTRRATARKVKEALEGTRARFMGTVLSDRRFPIPEAIYRRL